MTHLWVRAEQRQNEERIGITPEGVADLIALGISVTVEHSHQRAIPIEGYLAAGATPAPEGSWTSAPDDAIIFGLKELPTDGTPLRHRHILFGHAFKRQPDGEVLLRRFGAGGGTLFDLEYLTDADGRRVAAFGYWAGYAGAAVALRCWIAQQQGALCAPLRTLPSAAALRAELQDDLAALGSKRPDAIVIGALGRVGTGATDLCTQMGMTVTGWDMAETAHGGPFPQILDHAIFLNCILARPGTPVFVPATVTTAARALRVIGDIACDPDSAFSPIKVYDRTTSWDSPALRVHDAPPLDVTAIDNLPSLLPVESSQDYAAQLLPTLRTLGTLDAPVWQRAAELFRNHLTGTKP
ncbi:saccharopine dehydrogenase [Puniceibacterium sp. IMCC21224]|uniref:saccharopine dehydrogenase n=1 Tax=Puniceibacterium sp. IMCC21224 TaxID=1618204 RepID=UPI00064D914F|nr:saccharopine dehydrogenase [Puniceibacterium sp. IMCC21224]KMK68711.1 saccharopine dehydrogenase (NAD+, L-lysine-forming) [Puniceibacterium sp. IMCC21224]